MIKFFLKYLKKSNKSVSSIKKYSDYIDVASSTFLNNSSIRFSLQEQIENRKYVVIGERCIINASFVFESSEGSVKIGDNVHLGGVNFISRNFVEICNDVTMAWGITIYDHNSHSIYWEERKDDNRQCYEDYIKFGGNNIVNKDWSNVVSKPIRVESKVWIGFDVAILKGVTIGEGAVVAAKSVVVKDVEPWTVVAGNPARVVKYLPEYQKVKV